MKIVCNVEEGWPNYEFSPEGHGQRGHTLGTVLELPDELVERIKQHEREMRDICRELAKLYPLKDGDFYDSYFRWYEKDGRTDAIRWVE
jgi:hypothetical protein